MWQPLGVPGNLRGVAVYSLAVYNGQLIAGGAFPGGVARWDGHAWGPMNALSGPVNALGVSAGRLYAGGAFAPGPGAPQNGVTRWVE